MKKRVLPLICMLAVLSVAVLVSCGHKHDYELKQSADKHWQECDCGEKKDEGAHADANGDGKCDVCDYAMHAHAYELKNDAENHWQECACGDKKDESAHVDAVNNQTQEDVADRLCDVCGRQATVVFDVLGHGEAPAAQYIALGAAAVQPATPVADAYKFKGWFADAACTQPFDFTAAVAAPVTVYAKWEEDTTPGASIKYAHRLVKDRGDFYPVEQGSKIYFAYTADKTGRYTIKLQGPNSLLCNFATDLDEQTYGDGCDASVKNFDLKKDQTVVVTLTCSREMAADATASLVLSDCTDEPLPADGFLDGEYFNSTYTLVIDRANKTVLFQDNPYAFKYVGGQIDTLSFVQTMNLGSFTATTTYSLTRNQDGTYRLTSKGDAGSINVTLVYVALCEPIPLAKFSGRYAPKNGAAMDITEIMIYEDGSGYYVQNTHKYTQEIGKGAVHNAKRNMLSFGQYSFTLNLDENDNVTGLIVTGAGIATSAEYVRTGNAVVVPDQLPLGGDGNEYYGEQFTIVCAYNSQYWGSSFSGVKVVVTDYNNGLYTLKVDKTVYTAEVEGEGDALVVKLYDAAHNELLDTLRKLVIRYSDLPASNTTLSLAKADFVKGHYFFKATETGWYSFTLPAGATVQYKPNDTAKPIGSWTAEAQSGQTIRLAQGEIVAVYIDNMAETPETVSVSITREASMPGLSEDDPIELTDGRAIVSEMDNESTYYFRFTAPTTAEYNIAAMYLNLSTGNPAYTFRYVIKGNTYGYDVSSWKWTTGMSADQPYVKLNLTADEQVIIAVDRIGTWGTIQNVTVMAFRDQSQDATALTQDSGSITNGVYTLGDSKDVQFVHFTADADFTVTYAGLAYTGKDVRLTPNDMKYGVQLTGTATYEIEYAEGSKKNPVRIDALGMVYAAPEQYVMATAPEGVDVLLTLEDFESEKFAFKYNNETYGYVWDGDTWDFVAQEKTALPIAAGQSVIIYILESPSETVPVVLGVDYSVGATALEFVKGAPQDGKLTATATASSGGKYYIASTQNENVTVTADAAFTLTLAANNRQFTATEKDGKFTLQITMGENIYFVITADAQQSYTFTIEFLEGSLGYPKAIELQEGTATLTVDSARVVFFSLPAGHYKIVADQAGAACYAGSGEVELGVAFEVKEGMTLSALASRMGRTTFTITQADPDEQPQAMRLYVGTSKNVGDPISVSLKVNADMTEGTYIVDSLTYSVTITDMGDGTYKFIAAEGEWDEETVTFTVVGNTLLLDGSYVLKVTLTLREQ